jgi:hypothetical protein
MSVTVFGSTGSVQTYTVPDGVFRVYVDLWGAGGGGGLSVGGRLQGFLRVTPGQVLNLYVGGAGTTTANQIGAFGGYNGGGTGGSTGTSGAGGYGGGGATDIRVGGTALANRICVAGGAGGIGRAGAVGSGGVGGGTTGGAGVAGGSGETGGGGGTQAAGGGAGTSTGASSAATAGTQTVGGFGSSNNTTSGRGGGGGGGGYFCGGGGGSNGTTASSGGGGGSSYIGQLTDAADSPGDPHCTGDGQITIYTGISISTNANSTFISTDFTIPSDVGSMVVDLIGGMGGGYPIDPDGGNAGRLKGALAVTPGQSYRFTPGGMGTIRNPNTNAQNNGGANGGGAGIAVATSGAAGAGGGGGSDIRTGGTALANRICAAGGGGGISGGGVAGGAGGGTTGASGGAVGTSVTAATGGTQAAGGTHGNSGAGGSTVATNGALGVGGNGAANSTTTTARGGGGAGGGYYGGGGGGSIAAAGSGGGGAGGSNYIGSLTGATDIQGDAVDGLGDGSVTVNFDTAVGIGDPNDIALRGSSDIVNWTAGTAFKLQYPNLVVTDDIIVVYQTTNGTIWSPPPGWNSGPTAVVGGVVRLSMWWKRASGLEAGDLDVTIPSSGTGWMLMQSYSGCVKWGTPYTTSAVNQASSANTALNSGSINAVASADDGRYFQVAAWSWGTAQSGVPTVFGWTNSAGTSGSINSGGNASVRGIFTSQAYYTATTAAVPFTATLKTSSTWVALTYDLLKQPPSMNGVQSAFESSIDSYWTTNNQLSASLVAWSSRGEVQIGVATAYNTGLFPKALGAARTMIDASLTWRMRAVNLDQGPAQMEVGVIDQVVLNGSLAFWLGWGVQVGAGTGAVLEAVVNGGSGGDIAIVNLPTETGAVWCNITESGGIVTMSYSIDGRKWIPLLITPWAGKIDLRSCVPVVATLPEGATSGQAALHQFYWGPVNVASPHQRPLGIGLRYNQCPVPNFDGAPNPNSLVKLPAADSTFEGGTVGSWLGGGTGAPSLTNSTAFANSGTHSLLITWGSGSFPFAAPSALTGLIVGKRYFLKAMVRVPSGHPDIKIFCDSGDTGAPTSIKGAFTPVSLSFVAIATSHQLEIWPNTSPTTGQQCYVDDVVFQEDIDFWLPGGSIPPIIEPSTDFADSGTKSLKVTWMGNGSLPGFNTNGDRSMECIVGHQYVIAFRHLATNSAYPMLSAVVSGIGLASPYSGWTNDTTRDGTWKTYIGVFTATATLHSFSFWPTTTPSIGQITYFDSVVFEDIDTFDPHNPIFDGNSAGGGWELHPNNSRSYVVKHSEAVATKAIGAAVVTSPILGQDKASGTVASSGAPLGGDQASGSVASSGTPQGRDAVLGTAATAATAQSATQALGTAASSGAETATNSGTGAAATSGSALATDPAVGSAATAGLNTVATASSGAATVASDLLGADAASGTAVSSASPVPGNTGDGSCASSGAVTGNGTFDGSTGSSGAITGIGHGGPSTTHVPSNVETGSADGTAATDGQLLSQVLVAGQLLSAGLDIAGMLVSITHLLGTAAPVATFADGSAASTATLLGTDHVEGVVASGAVIETLAAFVNGVLTLQTNLVGSTFADGEVVSAGDVVFGFHAFVVAQRTLTSTAEVATAVLAERHLDNTEDALGTVSGALTASGVPMGTHTAPNAHTVSTSAEPGQIFDGAITLTPAHVTTLLQANQHQLTGLPEVIFEVQGLVQSLGEAIGAAPLLQALQLGQVALAPGVVDARLLTDLTTALRTRADGVLHLTTLVVQVHGDFFLWDGTALMPVELLGLWDGTRLTRTTVDGVWDGTHTIPQGFLQSTT